MNIDKQFLPNEAILNAPDESIELWYGKLAVDVIKIIKDCEIDYKDLSNYNRILITYKIKDFIFFEIDTQYETIFIDTQWAKELYDLKILDKLFRDIFTYNFERVSVIHFNEIIT